MDDLKIEEQLEYRIMWVTTPKRKERIKIFVPKNGFSNWVVRYESGQNIPEIEGSFTNKHEALRVVKLWLKDTKPSKNVSHDIWFGEDQKKEVKRKSVRAPAIREIYS